MMSDNRLSFEQIISTISDAEMMVSYPRKNKADLDTDNQKQISPEKQRFYLAFYAKAAYEHVGFDGFSKQNQENFKTQIENLYASISRNRPQGEFLNNLAQKTARYIEDRHFEIDTGNQTFHGGGENPQRSVGSNFFYNKNKPANYQSLGQGWSEEFGEKFPTWEIGSMKQENEDILVVSIPNLDGKNDYESWKDFIETFDKVYFENKEQWERGRILLDARGNRGGKTNLLIILQKDYMGTCLTLINVAK